ncbi:hypothetical protein [Streptomyces sp. FIT100]|uniref:hypothetical protein n=1 Tax=Streptomyces sp. FIT100 TaxID=2837956 RepID=UPI0021C71580|nr:hypothetical protein [Streptomyces sp. FIT100]UUN25532.1 hypothetical protein KK483_03190 [Streptomyces sp. FIT100]
MSTSSSATPQSGRILGTVIVFLLAVIITLVVSFVLVGLGLSGPLTVASAITLFISASTLGMKVLAYLAPA